MGGGGGVQADSSPSAESVQTDNAASPTALAESSVTNAGSETATDGQASESTDPLEGIPSAEELEQQVAQNVPYAKGLQSLRGAYEALKTDHEPLKAWKDIAGSTDPATVQSNQELLGLLYSPTQNGNPNDYSTTPFLERIEQDSPGSLDKVYRDLTGMAVEINGQRDTLTRHMVRSWGLNPDNLEKYRQLENGTLSVASGIVSTEDLAKIPQAYHEGFKALPAQAQRDILSLNGSEHEADRLTAQAYLQNAQQAVDAQTFREGVERERQATQQAKEADTQRKIDTESQTAIDQLTSEVYDSIRQNLAQVKVSTDELENELHVGRHMALLYTAIDPAGRKMILDPLLAKLGVSLDSSIAGVQVRFEDTVNTIDQKTREAIRWEHYGDKRQAAAAKAAANQSRQILTAKLNQVAMKLVAPAKPNGDGATARMIPSGNGLQQQGSQNPYDANPHPFGSPEYSAFNRKIDRQLAAQVQ